MASDTSDDGLTRKEPAAGSSAAFAATIAPELSAPPVSPVGTAGGAANAEELVEGELALPVVSALHYRPDREIARGGMGRIVAAEDQRLGRAVALKELIEQAPEQRSRFQREALITARLQHPGIVPVYEAGCWPSGEPFFAMKLVSGRPLDRVIAEAKGLVERLALLPQIAAATDAIAYAHSQRVIHRDLKPANILVGEFGETVVIDWGLAKHLDDVEAPMVTLAARPAKITPTNSKPKMISRQADRSKRPSEQATSTLTVAGAVMGTPAYMAPEQARGEPLDQRADVFALGAMLYHLLAGAPPYDAKTATDVITAAAMGQVIPLTRRERGAPPDLVAIVDRAMAPLPIDRYASAGELASELRRFLTGQLVSAHRYTTVQRVRRFVRRHRAAVVIAALALIGFAVGGSFSVRQIMAERDAADQAKLAAEARRHGAEQLIDKMLSDLKARLQQMGRLDLLESLGSEIRDYYATFAKTPGGMSPDDLERMTQAIDAIGVAERDSGKLDQAFATWSDARAALAAGGLSGERTLTKRLMIARLDFEIGTIHQQRGKLEPAMTAYTLAKREFSALLDEAPADRQVLLGSAEIHDRLGDMLRNDGKIDEAFDEYTQAKAHRERAASSPASRPQEEILALSTSHFKLGVVYQGRDSAKALDELRVALRLREGQLAGQRDDVDLQNKVLEVQFALGDLQSQVGDPKSAIETYKKALPAIDALTRRDPANTTWRRLRGNMVSNYGFALIDRGDYRAGLEQLTAAIEIQQALTELDPKSRTWQSDLSRSYTRAGDAQLALGDAQLAIASYRHGLEIRKDLVADDPKSAPYRRSMAWSYTKLGTAYLGQNDLANAIEAEEAALKLRSELVDESPGQGGFRNELSATQTALAPLIAARDPGRAKQLLDAGLAQARSQVTSDPLNNEWHETLVQGLLAAADAAQATNDASARETALAEALTVSRGGIEHAPTNVRWAGYIADVHAGYAELAVERGDRLAAALEWKSVRDALEPLARAFRLSVQRTALLTRARAGA